MTDTTPPSHRRLAGGRALLLGVGALLLVLTSPIAMNNADAQEFSSSEYDVDIPDMTGTWALKTVMTALSDPPVVGQVTNRTITYLKVTIDQDGTDLALNTEVCDVKMTSDFKRIRTVIPQAFVEALPDARRTGRLRRQGDQWGLEVDKHLSVLGANLRQPSDEYLPTEPDDPRVVDADEDGHPGVTVRVEGMVNGELYLVQRGWEQFTGTLQEGGDRVSGLVAWNSEQKVLDSNSMFLGKQPPTEPHPDENESTFDMVRIDTPATCKELKNSF